MSNLKSKYGLPEKVLFCKKCVISNQRPITLVETKHSYNEKKQSTAFDENGICNACLHSEKKNKINYHLNFLFLIKLLTALIKQATPPFIS